MPPTTTAAPTATEPNMRMLPLEIVRGLHIHLEAAVADCTPTEEMLLRALEAYARSHGIDSDTLQFNYTLYSIVHRLAREGCDDIQFAIEDDPFIMDMPLEVN